MEIVACYSDDESARWVIWHEDRAGQIKFELSVRIVVVSRLTGATDVVGRGHRVMTLSKFPAQKVAFALAPNP